MFRVDKGGDDDCSRWRQCVAVAAHLFFAIEVVLESFGKQLTSGTFRLFVCAVVVLWIERRRLYSALVFDGSADVKQAGRLEEDRTRPPRPGNTSWSGSSGKRVWWRTSFDCCFREQPDILDAEDQTIDVQQCDLLEVQVLRENLSDLFGKRSGQGVAKPPAGLPERAAAMASVEMYGGEHTCLTRFLRARQMDTQKAEAMLRATFEFRRINKVNGILDDAEMREIWMPLRPLWPYAPVMYTASGNLVVYSRMAHFFKFWSKGVAENHVRILYIAVMEQTLKLQRFGWSERNVGGEMPGVYEVFDFQGVNWSMASAIGAIRMMARILRIGQEHYPENLKMAAFINLPRFAVKGFQAFSTAVFDENTQAKFAVSSDDGREMLRRILQVAQVDVDAVFHSIVPYREEHNGGDCRNLLGTSELMGTVLV